MKNSHFFKYLLFLRDSRRKSGVGKMNGTVISQRERQTSSSRVKTVAKDRDKQACQE
jgi:hypothetical protein